MGIVTLRVGLDRGTVGAGCTTVGVEWLGVRRRCLSVALNSLVVGGPYEAVLKDASPVGLLRPSVRPNSTSVRAISTSVRAISASVRAISASVRAISTSVGAACTSGFQRGNGVRPKFAPVDANSRDCSGNRFLSNPRLARGSRRVLVLALSRLASMPRLGPASVRQPSDSPYENRGIQVAEPYSQSRPILTI